MTIRCGFQVNLEGRIAIITGAARGIGRAVAECFAGAGADVIAVDMREAVMDAHADIRGQWHGYRADVSNPSEVGSLTDYCLSTVGRPDILVNVAGISTPSPVNEMSLENWKTNIDVNLTSVFLCSRAVLPHMMDKRSGCIISFSSVIARTGGESSAHYCAAKAGIEGFSRSLAREAGPYGVRVNVVAPGIVETQMLELMPTRQKEKLVKRLPLGRAGFPEDMTGLTLLLASDAASYITGQTIHINGGLFMG